MLLAADAVTAVPLALPPAEHPGPEEAPFLRDWGTALARALATSLSVQSTRTLDCRCSGWRVLESDWRPAAETVSLDWGPPGPQWQLCLPEPAVSEVLAGLLGQATLAAGQALTPTDLALLDLQAVQIARQVSQDLQLPPSASHSVAVGAGLLPPSPRVGFDLTLVSGSLATPLQLVAGWAQISEFSPLRAGAEASLSAADVSHARLTVEAILPGPTLVARDLLGLQPGDIVQLGNLQRPTILRIAGRPIAVGRAGARAGALAVSIHEVADLTESGSHGS